MKSCAEGIGRDVRKGNLIQGRSSEMKLSRRSLMKAGPLAMAAALLGRSPAGGEARARSLEGESHPDAGSVWEQPPKQKGNNLNLILLVSDTFRADNLACYGSQWIECPNLNKFAQDCIIFEDCYPEGLPTVPVRRTLWTGRRILPFHYYRQHEPVQLPGWHQLYNEDVTLSETLLEAGYIPALIADIPHIQRPDRNFHRGYRHYEWIRGQEIDYYGTAPHKQPDVSDIVSDQFLAEIGPEYARLGRTPLPRFLAQYKANRRRWEQDGESLVELMAEAAIRWLRANHDQQPFLLHFEAFDPHEPWDPPRQFLERYYPNPTDPNWVEPPYADIPLSKEITKRMRANYAGEVTCVDHWIGKVLETIGELGLFENSIVVFLSDHGALLGEQGQFLKGPERMRTQVTHVPLLIRLPGKQHAGKRVSGFVQIPDLMPTLLSLLNLKPPRRVTGENLWPLVVGETKSIWEHAFHGHGWIGAVRTREWNYTEVVNQSAYRGNYKPQLYNSESDPQELVNIVDRYPDVARKLSALLKEYIASGRDITGGSFNERGVPG